MIDFLPIQVNSTIDWSLIFLIFAAVSFYFGKLISETSVYKENKYSTYVSGLIFMILFVIFPPIVLYTIFENSFLGIPYVLALFLQFIITYYLGKRITIYAKIQRMKIDKFFSELMKKKTNQVIKNSEILDKFTNVEITENMTKRVFFNKIPDWLLMIFALLNFWFSASVIFLNPKPIYVFLSLLFLFVSLSSLAILFGSGKNKRPKVTVHLNNNEKISGELSKIDPGYVNIITDNNVYHINESQVRYIEVPIFLKGAKKKIKKKVLTNT